MAQLQLSTQLISQVCETLEQNDAGAADPGIASQYLSAIIGFLLGQQNMPLSQKEEILEELGAFALHVVKDVEQQRQQQSARPAAPPQEAFGIWKPGMS
ncbi:MAG: hypothetical protein KDJ38_14980 [Gammaproteobacteria bacterium]|nr:hypothetical protein [Gammaproteobacteria bacterium]